MVFRLTGDVSGHRAMRGGTHSKCSVAFLPGKPPMSHLIMHPKAGGLLELSHEIRQPVRRLKPNQKVDMIPDTADLLRKGVESAHCAAKVLVQARPPKGLRWQERDPW